jgi:hypothetical protein
MTAVDLYGSVTAAILRLFPTYDRLEDFARGNLGLWLNQITDRSKGLTIVAADIAKWAESRGNDKLLVVRLQQRHPGDAALRDLIAELGLDPAAYPAVAVSDLTGLEAVAADPQTRAILAPYRLDLQQLCLTAIRIGGWKYLHDNVDLLRTLVVAPLSLIIRGPPHPGHRLEVMKLATELAKRTTNITTRAAEMKLRDREIGWVAARLLPAQAQLQAALQAWPGQEQLGQATTALGIVTSSDLSLLNGNIKTVAAMIDALNLPEKLQDLQATIAASMADAAAAAQTNAEIRSMDQRVVQVLDLVDHHDQWQLLKDAFDNFSTVESVTAARDAWGRVNYMIDAIIEKPDDLMAGRTTMAAALATDDFYDAIQTAIGELNAVISNHFLAIDGDLLNAAGELGKMGTTLSQVLEKFDG